MSSLPPGYVRCTKNPDHVYPATYEECDICSKGSANLDLVDLRPTDRTDPVGLVGIGVFVAFFAIIAFFAIKGAQQAPVTKSNTPDTQSPVQRVISSTYQGMVSTVNPNAQPAARAPSVGENKAQVSGTGGATTIQPVLAKNTTADADDLAGKWSMSQAENDRHLGTYNVTYQQGHIGIERIDGTTGSVEQNISSVWYDGNSWRLAQSYGAMGDEQISLVKVSAGHFEGSEVVRNTVLARVKFIKNG